MMKIVQSHQSIKMNSNMESANNVLTQDDNSTIATFSLCQLQPHQYQPPLPQPQHKAQQQQYQQQHQHQHHQLGWYQSSQQQVQSMEPTSALSASQSKPNTNVVKNWEHHRQQYPFHWQQQQQQQQQQHNPQFQQQQQYLPQLQFDYHQPHHQASNRTCVNVSNNDATRSSPSPSLLPTTTAGTATPTKVFYPPLSSFSSAALRPSTASPNILGTILGRTKPKICPGRLFVRINNDHHDKLSFSLGEFTIAIKYAEIEPDIVDRARKRLLKRAEKDSLRRKHREQQQQRRQRRGAIGGVGSTPRTILGEVYEIGKGNGAMERRDDTNEFGARKEVVQDEEEMATRMMMMLEEPKLAYLEITHASASDDKGSSFASTPFPSSSAHNKNNGDGINDPTLRTKRSVWSSSPGLNFVGASSLSAIDIQSNDNRDDITNGNIMGINNAATMIEQFNRIYSIQTIDRMQRGRRCVQGGQAGVAENVTVDNVVTISGQLGHEISPQGELLPSKWNNVKYTMEFSLTEGCTRGLQFKLRVEGGGVCDGGGAVGMKKNRSSHIDEKFGERRDTGTVVELDYTVNSAHIFLKSEEDEAYFGLGARMSRSNLRGLEVHVCHPTTSSSSSGRSNSGRNQYSTKSTNSSSTMPHFITSLGTSLHLHNTEPSIFDFTNCIKHSLSNSSWYSIRVPCSVIEGTFLVGTSPLHACELHTSVMGRAPLIPKWAQERGIFVGITGGTLNVHRICKTMFKHKTAIAGVLIKDWTGVKCNLTSSLPTGSLLGGPVNSTGLIGGGKNNGNNMMWYNWVLERAHYPKWQSLVDSLERRGISVGLHICPYVEEIPKHLNSGRRHLFAEVQQGEYFVKKKRTDIGNVGVTCKSKTSNGTMTTNSNSLAGGGGRRSLGNQAHGNVGVRGTTMYNQFKRTKCGILDPTNFNAMSWFKQTMREEVFGHAGASFWMTDMGIGGPPVDGFYTTNPSPDHSVAITTGMSGSGGESKSQTGGLFFHNSYAEEWAKVNRDILRDAGREGDAFFIMDSAYSSTAAQAGYTCLGDYIADFCNDGSTSGDGSDILRAVLNGLLNGGFSGLTNGHCAVNLAVPRSLANAIGHSIDSRSREMICRWFEMTAFTAFFRTHDGEYGARELEESGSMFSAHDDEVVLRSLALWSHVFVALSEYRSRLLSEASFKGYPVVRHPLLHFPNDEKFVGNNPGKKVDSFSCSSSFMMGDLIYVAPILKCGVVKSKVYLPQGAWIHLWSGDEVAGPHNFGKIVEVPAPIGEPPVFIRDNDVMRKFVATLRTKRIIKARDTDLARKTTILSSIRRRIKH